MAVSTLQVLISEPLRHLIFYSVVTHCLFTDSETFQPQPSAAATNSSGVRRRVPFPALLRQKYDSR